MKSSSLNRTIELIAFGLFIPVAIVLLSFAFTFALMLLIAFVIAFLIWQVLGVPIDIIVNGERRGELRRFKYRPNPASRT